MTSPPLLVYRIEPELCRPWLLERHYAKRLCSISYAFGLYEERQLVGVCTFGKPASPSLCTGVCGEENSEYVYELNRLVVDSNRGKNELSFFVASCLRSLPPLILVSYADTAQGHHGYIYQATNWVYTGLSAKRNDKKPKGSDKHGRHSHTAKDVEFEYVERSEKHRYIYFTGSKTQRKHWRRALNYEPQPYPKGENGRYETRSIYSQAQLF